MNASNRLIVSILVVAALAIGFWMLLLGPKRDEASELSSEAGQLQVALSEAQSKAAQAEAARQEFPADYRQLVVLGQAVPADDETSSLLVELSSIAEKSQVKFESIQLESSAGGAAAPAPTPAPAPAPAPAGSPPGSVPASSMIPPTEAAASLLPLGASIGTAGLGVMPYGLTFKGNFFQIASFIKGIDSLVHTGKAALGVDGRLVTLDGFSLTTEPESSALKATFSVTTYVTPPTQGVTAGATSSAPAPVTTPAGAGETAAQAASATTSSETN
jgi:Tfp pilus assembly protein PilO